MKSVIILALSCLLPGILPAQNKLSPAQWQEDIRELQKTVHTSYPFLFKKVTADHFDAATEQLIREVPQLQDHEVAVGISRLVALFGYGHTSLDWDGGVAKSHRIPVNMYWFNDGIYLEGVHKNHPQALGAKVIKVEGKDIQDVIQSIRPMFPVENEQFFKAYILNDLCLPEVLHAQKVTSALKNSISLTLEKNGTQFIETFTAQADLIVPRKYGFITPGSDWLGARGSSETPLYLKNLERIYFFEYLPALKTVYVRHSQIQDDPQEAIPQFYQRLLEFTEQNEVEKLILDVRLNGGGNNYKNRDIVRTIIRSKFNEPGKFLVIIGRRTFSACQNLVNELDKYTQAIFIGEPTGQNINFYGDNNRVELPHSKIPVHLSFAWWQDKPVWEDGPWTAPHLAAEMSFADYINNQDPALNAALNFADRQFIRDPMGHLEKLFNQGKLAEVQSEAQRMVNDPHYKFYDFEKALNSAAMRLAARKNLSPAAMVLKMCSNLFPQSILTWYNLGEVALLNNGIQEARNSFQKVIDMAPHSTQASQAKLKLTLIREK